MKRIISEHPVGLPLSSPPPRLPWIKQGVVEGQGSSRLTERTETHSQYWTEEDETASGEQLRSLTWDRRPPKRRGAVGDERAVASGTASLQFGNLALAGRGSGMMS